MSTKTTHKTSKNTPQGARRARLCARGILSAAAALALLGTTARVFADAPVTMAPPTDGGYSQDGYSQDGYSQDRDAGPVSAGQDSVFQWTEVPQDQRVPLTRAVFDRSGYQLFDAAGETVLVPFTNNNLYVMKFAPSDDGTLYLVNRGDAPVLYVPSGGFLENAAQPGARWYPFSDDFHPARPVYLGVAPSWTAFVSIGWTPDLVIRGGYWGHDSFLGGGVFLPSAGLVFEFGGHRYSGWEPYHSYIIAHPDHFRFGYADGGYRPRVFRGGPGYGHDGYGRDGYGHDAYSRDAYSRDAYAHGGDRPGSDWHDRGGFGGDRPADRTAARGGGPGTSRSDRGPRTFRGARGDWHGGDRQDHQDRR